MSVFRATQFLGALLLLAAASSAWADTPAQPVVAVVFEVSDPGLASSAGALRDAVSHRLSKAGMELVDPQKLRAILEKQREQQKAVFDESKTVQLGLLVGAQAVVIGSLRRGEQSCTMWLPLFDVETGVVLRSVFERNLACNEASLIAAAGNLASELARSDAPASDGPRALDAAASAQAGQRDKRIAYHGTGRKTGGCPDGMVYRRGGVLTSVDSDKRSILLSFKSYCIDGHEYPNRGYVAPIAKVAYEDAAGRCASAGKRLCTATEWEMACRDDDFRSFPYGEAFAAQSCQTGESKARESGARAACHGRRPIYDLSGNVWEWVDSDPALRTGVVMGGDWAGKDDAVSCGSRAQIPKRRTEENVGFRCCRNVDP